VRIAHFINGRCNPESANGVDKAVYYLRKCEADLGHEVALFSLTAKPVLTVPGVTVRGYSPGRLPWRLPQRLLADVKVWKPDIVHLHSSYVPANALLGWWLRRHGIPYIVTPHGGLSPHVLRRRWYLKAPYRRAFELPLLNGALFVHSVGDEEDIRRYGVNVPVITAPNGIDLDSIPKTRDPNALRKRIPAIDGKRVFLFLGRLDPLHKGLHLFLDAFAAARLSNAVVVFVGPDWKGGRFRLEHLAKKLGVSSLVHFTGPLYGKEKYDALESADVFFQTSRWEGLPLSVLEACAMAKPCLLSPAADPLGLLGAEDAAIIAPPRPGGMTESIRQMALMSEPDLRSVGGKALDLVSKNFTWERTARTLLSYYKRRMQ